jgi:hypothetical protein
VVQGCVFALARHCAALRYRWSGAELQLVCREGGIEKYMLLKPSNHESTQVDEGLDILNIFGRDIADLPLSQRDLWLNYAFQYWRSRGFPYPQLSQVEMQNEFKLLERVSFDKILIRGWARSSTVGLRLANAFHPQMWKVPVHGRSPVDRFEDDDTLRKALLKAVRFWPDRRCWNAQCIRSVMRILHRARVSNFRPAVARAIIERFSRSGQQIVDFSAGYGGRLLGALTLRRNYIGVDPAKDQINGLRRMTQSLRGYARADAQLYQACAEDFLPHLPAGKTDLVFTSPPYYDLERYSREDTQSCVRYSTYSEWKERFLKVVIMEAYRLLRKGGYLVLNVADVGKYTIATDAITIASRIFGTETQLIRMMMSTMPAERAKGSDAFRWEPILVWAK